MQDAIAVQSLKSDIALLRQNIWPPTNLSQCRRLTHLLRYDKLKSPNIMRSGRV